MIVPLRKALFLDRDGIVNVDRPYVYTRAEFEFMPGIFELCREAKARDYLLFVITNQAGIGRGLYTEADFAALTTWMCGVFAEEGCVIERVYHCPTHPVHGVGAYKRDSYRRKPAPGMILEAAQEYSIDLASSVLLGDKSTDVQAGAAAGVGHLLLLRAQDSEESLPASTRVVTNLHEARRLLSDLAR